MYLPIKASASYSHTETASTDLKSVAFAERSAHQSKPLEEEVSVKRFSTQVLETAEPGKVHRENKSMGLKSEKFNELLALGHVEGSKISYHADTQILDYVSSALCLAILIIRITLESLSLKARRRRRRRDLDYHLCFFQEPDNQGQQELPQSGPELSPLFMVVVSAIAATSLAEADLTAPSRSWPANLITNIDHGDNVEISFLMIRSVDTRNIFTCWDDNLWATSPVDRGNFLVDAFDTSGKVALSFSANASQTIQDCVIYFGGGDQPLPRDEVAHR
ncbi:hypothetical protein PG988_005628 [Apiospora saccharicola]